MNLPGIAPRNTQLNSTISDFKNVGMNSTMSTFNPKTNRITSIKGGLPFTPHKLNNEQSNSGAFTGARTSALTNITSTAGSVLSPKSIIGRHNLLSPVNRSGYRDINASELQVNLNKTFSNLNMGSKRKNDNEDISSKIQKSLISCCQKRKKQNKKQKEAYMRIVTYFRQRY